MPFPDSAKHRLDFIFQVCAAPHLNKLQWLRPTWIQAAQIILDYFHLYLEHSDFTNTSWVLTPLISSQPRTFILNMSRRNPQRPKVQVDDNPRTINSITCQRGSPHKEWYAVILRAYCVTMHTYMVHYPWAEPKSGVGNMAEAALGGFCIKHYQTL